MFKIKVFFEFLSYVELVSDHSVVHVVSSYLKRGDHNVLVLDWSNLAFGNYLNVLLDVPLVSASLCF